MKRWPLIAAVAAALFATGCVPPGGSTNGPPPAPAGVKAGPGGGSGEVVVTWDPLPAAVGVAHFRVYENRLPGQFWLLGVVTDEALGTLEPGRLGIVDAPDYWPWPTLQPPNRCYVVSAVSTSGLEGPFSSQVCGSAP